MTQPLSSRRPEQLRASRRSDELFAGADITAPVGAWTPFDEAVEADPTDIPEGAPEGSYTYALVQSAPEVPADEVETDELACEVRVRWGDNTLHVSHLSPVRPFFIGEEERKNIKCDYLVPEETLGSSRMALVNVWGTGTPAVVLPAIATGRILDGGVTRTLDEVRQSGEAVASTTVSGAVELPLKLGRRAEIQIGELVFEIVPVRAAKKIAGSAPMNKSSFGYTGLSAAFHVGLLAAMAVFLPPLGATAGSDVSDEQRFIMAQAFDADAATEREDKEDMVNDNGGEEEGGTGERHAGEEGKAGSEVSTAQNKKWALKGDASNPDNHLSRAEAIRAAQDFGMIGILNNMSGDPDAMKSPWGEITAEGDDAFSALGNMWGDELGEAAGAGGIGLSGIGEGGGCAGGNCRGVGLGAIGFGHGAGLGTGDGFGNGVGSGILPGGHKTRAPSMKQGVTTASGRLPPEVIQRVVRQNFGRFRLCYQQALQNNPNLAGRVAVSFVIGSDGAVSMAQNAGSDLPDAATVSCVVRNFYNLSFPQPENGIVTVTYPIVFSPAQ